MYYFIRYWQAGCRENPRLIRQKSGAFRAMSIVKILLNFYHNLIGKKTILELKNIFL